MKYIVTIQALWSDSKKVLYVCSSKEVADAWAAASLQTMAFTEVVEVPYKTSKPPRRPR